MPGLDRASCTFVLLTIGLAVCSGGACLGRIQVTADATVTQEAIDIPSDLREQRSLFQSQTLITAKPNAWLFQPGDTPRLIWRDVDLVRRLGVREPFRVRWINARLEEADVPDAPGRWGALVEGTAPNGTPFRRSLTFYAPDPDSFVFLTPEVTVSLPGPPASPTAAVWKEHEDELSRISTDLLRQSFFDNQTTAIILAGMAESKPLGRPARFVDSFDVLDQDFHLAIKLRVLGLADKVRSVHEPTRRDVPAVRLHDGSPSQAGMREDAKERIDAVCREWARDTGEPFVTLVARNGVIVTHEVFGTDSAGEPIDTEYRCWVASITKTVTSLLFAQFVDQGLIGLDDSLARVFPDFSADDPHVPTFRQCLTHTSGLTGHGGFGGFRNPHLENVVANGIDVNEPNATYSYSGLGFDLAAKAMEIVSGKSAVRLYNEQLFNPLGFGDVIITNGSADGHFTARELALLAQCVANRGSYGDLQFMSSDTFDQLLPRPLKVKQNTSVSDEGIGLHWVRHLKEGAPPNSTRPEDLLFSPRTVGHGSFSGCMLIIDLEQNLIITQARRDSGPRSAEWRTRFLQTVADSVTTDNNSD